MTVRIPEDIERYQHLSTPVVYDILDVMGYPQQALSNEVRALSPQMVVAGPAFIVEGRDYALDQSAPEGADGMFRAITHDYVIVMVTNGHSVSARWGENTRVRARARGARHRERRCAYQQSQLSGRRGRCGGRAADVQAQPDWRARDQLGHYANV